MTWIPRSIGSMPRRTGAASVLALLLLLAAPAWSDDEPSTRPRTEGVTDVTAVFDTIEAAWLRGDAADLVARFAPGRILMRLPGSTNDAAGHFSHQQCLLILRTLFDSQVVRRFAFQDIQSPGVAPGKAVGLAAVGWRMLGDGRTREGRMLVVLEPTERGWAVSEMQALP